MLQLALLGKYVNLSLGGVDQSLVAAYGFEEGSGDSALDITANRHEGTIVSASWVDGRFGSGLSFDGDSHVDIGSFDIAGSGLTIATWFNADAFGEDRLVTKATSSAEAASAVRPLRPALILMGA